jgi:hypothetical protein
MSRNMLPCRFLELGKFRLGIELGFDLEFKWCFSVVVSELCDLS